MERKPPWNRHIHLEKQEVSGARIWTPVSPSPEVQECLPQHLPFLESPFPRLGLLFPHSRRPTPHTLQLPAACGSEGLTFRSFCSDGDGFSFSGEAASCSVDPNPQVPTHSSKSRLAQPHLRSGTHRSTRPHPRSPGYLV